MRDAYVAMLRKLATDIQNGDIGLDLIEINTMYLDNDRENTETVIRVMETS